MRIEQVVDRSPIPAVRGLHVARSPHLKKRAFEQHKRISKAHQGQAELAKDITWGGSPRADEPSGRLELLAGWKTELVPSI